MCYDIKTGYEAQLKRAKRRGDEAAVEEIIENLIPYTELPIYHSSGFNHPNLLIYTNDSPDFPSVASWGLIPHWAKSEHDSHQIINKTLNARAETIFKLPSFNESAINMRCIIYIDGFYEHHHYNNKTYPYYIYNSLKEPLALAGLWSEWENPDTGGLYVTFSIVTTKGNEFMAKIHNNPKIKEPRMPLILNSDMEEEWLASVNSEERLTNMLQQLEKINDIALDAYTVNRLRGKSYKGNVSEINDKVDYKELKFNL